MITISSWVIGAPPSAFFLFARDQRALILLHVILRLILACSAYNNMHFKESSITMIMRQRCRLKIESSKAKR